jgi:hypothetical protein
MGFKTELPTGTDGANLVSQSGITVGRVTVWAANLGTDPGTFCEAVHATGQPVVDTATSKTRETHDRPQAASLRCIALTADHAARVLAYIASGARGEASPVGADRAPVAA